MPWYSCTCWKATIAFKYTFLKKQHFLKYFKVSFLVHSLFTKVILSIFQVLLRNLNSILQGLSRISSLRGLPSGTLGILFSMSFSSTFCCWIFFVFWKPTVLFDKLSTCHHKLYRDPYQSLHFWHLVSLCSVSLLGKIWMVELYCWKDKRILTHWNINHFAMYMC